MATNYYTKKTIVAGQPGTQKWVQKYGKALVCVRYKYDIKNKRKLKTVEIIVEEKPWSWDKKRIPGNKIVGIRVAYGEVELGRMIRAAGGKWDRKKKQWELPYRDAINLGLEERIITKEENEQI